MARYFIEDITFGSADGGELLGPIGDSSIVEIRIRTDEGDEFFVSA